MEFRNLKAFKKVAELGSFTKAAQELGYAQSTLTTQIQQIETFYGKPVFERLGKGIRLTSFGQRLLERTDALLAQYEQLQSLDDAETEPQGSIRIGAPESLMMYRLFPIIKEYKTRYPQVQVAIINDHCDYLRVRLCAGDLDISFLLQPDYSYSNLQTIMLKEEALCLVAPASYEGEDFLPDETHMALYTEKECTYRQVFDAYLKSNKYYPYNVLETQSVEAIKKFIRNGLGVSYLPQYAVQEEAEQGLLRIKPYATDLKLFTQLAYHKNKWFNPALQRFVALCRERSLEWE